MKIVYIANTKVPSTFANTVQIMNMCSAFNEAGHEVHLILPQPPKKSKSNSEISIFKFYGLKPNFKIHFVFSLFAGNFLRGFISSFFSVFMLLKIKPDLVYSRNYWLPIYIPVYRRPTIIEMHSINFSYKTPVILNVLRFFSKNKHLKKIVCISGKMHDFFLSLGINNQKLKIVHDAVNLVPYAKPINKGMVREKLGIPQSIKLVTYVGSFYMDRGIHLIFDAATKLNNVHFFLAGGVGKDLEFWKKELQCRNIFNVTLNGYLPHKDVPEILKASDILLMPYTSSVPTKNVMSPMKLFEYMASKVPVIASDFPVLREILNESNSCLIPPDSSQSIINSISNLLESQDTSKQLSEQAWKDVQNFSWQSRVENVLS